MLKIPTPHIEACEGDFSDTVLMPGDPLRAMYIANNYLTKVKCVNKVRNMLGYTGFYNDKKISVMSSGMGMPSMGIYSYELYNFYNVDNIIRIGSAGSISDNIKVRDIVVGLGACYNSDLSKQYNLDGTFSAVCSYYLLKKVAQASEKHNIMINIGNFLSTDIFYSEDLKSTIRWRDFGVIAVEMETAALYMNAARSGKKAISICTISDSIVSGQKCTSKEREQSFNEMIELALKTTLEV